MSEKHVCLPPDYFLNVYEECWERAFGSANKVWAHDSTAGGTFSVRRRAFKDLAKDMRGLDDIAMLDNLFNAVARAVRHEQRREQDAAAWHDEVGELIARLREIRS